jgi:transcriptional regulator with XRE-family HTH domain
MSIAKRMREAREAAGLSQGQVAKKLHMHRPTISEIEAGRRRISASEIALFAELYGVSTEWLISGSTENATDTRLLIAARELSKMSDSDIDRLMKMLRMLREPKKR